jgi:hypothetical protein
MNNELLDEVYQNYFNTYPDAEKTFQYEGHNIETRRMTKDEFVEMVKTDEEYGRRWGLKIEERELSLEERYGLMKKLDNWVEVHYKEPKTMDYMDKHNIPTKLITITYNNKTITSYD